MRNLNELNDYRNCSRQVLQLYESFGDDTYGVFNISFRGENLIVIASTGGEWDHVSVSVKRRCPNWYELEHVKRLFFKDDETAMQLHVPSSDHLCLADTTLHLWRPQNQDIPRPPGEFVGTRGLTIDSPGSPSK